MGLPVVVQAPTPLPSGTATSWTITLTNVTAGSLLVATAQCAAGVRTFVATDNNGNTWQTPLAFQAGSEDGAVCYAMNANAGTTIITVTCYSGGSPTSTNFRMAAYEVSGISPTAAYDVSGEFNDAAAADNHFCVGTGGVNTSANVFICCMGILSAAATSFTAGSGYTALFSDTQRIVQYGVFSGAMTGHRAPFASVGTDRACFAFMAAFKADAAGPLTKSTNDNFAVTDVPTPSLSANLVLTKSVVDSLAVSNVATATLSGGLPLTKSTFDTIYSRSRGNSNLSGATRVRENVQVFLSAHGSIPLSRASVDIALITEDVARRLNPTNPISRTLTDSIYVQDAAGQDTPISVREFVDRFLSVSNILKSDSQNVFVRDAVTTAVRNALLSNLVSDTIFTRERTVISFPSIDRAYVSDSLVISLHNALMTLSLTDSATVIEFLHETLSPIYALTPGDTRSTVTDFVVGFMSKHADQLRAIIEPVAVRDVVIPKYSRLGVLIYETIGTTDNKKKTRRTSGWIYEYTWRG